MLHNLKRIRYSVDFVCVGANTKIIKSETSKKLLCRCFATKETNLINCWKCDHTIPSKPIPFKCSKCQSLLELPKIVDHFELLNIERKFGIDSKVLTNQFRQIQNILHPDKFSNKSDKEQNLSAEWSALVNKAYKILMSPIHRAEYLLKSHQIEIPEENTISNPEFLMEMMERNEQVDEAKSGEDLTKLLNVVHEDSQKCVEKLEKLLAEKNLTEAKDQVIVLRYLLSLQNSIKEKGNRIGVIL